MPVYFILFCCLSIALSIGYVFIIYNYLEGWRALEEWEVPSDYFPKTMVTVIIPARNEEKNIINCLSSILNTNYPKELLEIIVVDDHSIDDTYNLVKDFSKKKTCFKIIKLGDFLKNKKTYTFKKQAIEIAINLSKGELIVTTDADCIVPANWLQIIVSFFEINKMELIAAPVNFYGEKSVFEKFQSLDFLGMMGVTGAGIQQKWMNMCNGANLAYSKKAFFAVEGFKDIDHLASGDDILLMQKIAAKFPNKIGFLKRKDATVKTEAKTDLKSFISQRLRWATKSGSYGEWRITFVLAIVFFYSCAILISLLMAPFLGWYCAVLFLFLLSVKSICDYLFLGEMTNFFERNDLMENYCPSQALHILYIVFIGFLGNVKKRYEWKGRSVK